MKKFFYLFFILCLIFIYGGFKADASEYQPNYCNLIDFSDITVDNNGKCSMNGTVTLNGSCYSMVCTSKFLGDAVPQEDYGEVEILYKYNNSVSGMDAYFHRLSGEMFYFDMSDFPTGNVQILDFVSRGLKKESLPIDEVIFYEGEDCDFKGFRTIDNYSKDYKYVTNELSIYTYTDSPISKSTLESMIISYDNYKGDVTGSLKYDYGTYNPESLSGGTYDINVTSTDEKNSSVLKVKVIAIDNTKPTIKGESTITWDINTDPWTKEDIIKQFEISDETTPYDKLTIEVSNYFSSYFVKSQRKGTAVNIIVTDEKGNQTIKTVKIEVKDSHAPEMTVKQNITINMSTMGILDDYAMKKYCIDNIVNNGDDYTLAYSINNEYEYDMTKPGTYNVDITCYNYFGLSTTAKVVITVIDDISPEFYVKSFVLDITVDNPYSESDFINAIKKNLKNRGIAYENVDIISNNYKADVEGTYELLYSYSYLDVTNYESITINTIKASSNNKWLYSLISIPVLTMGAAALLLIKGKKKKIIRIS